MTDYFFKKGLGVECILYLSGEKDYLLTREADGQPAHHFLQDPEKLCRLLADILKRIHCLEVEDAPIQHQLEQYVKRAQFNYEKGAFYERALLPCFQIQGREEAYAIMCKNGHRLSENAFIHGDFCLPNVILKEKDFSCVIDLGLAGKSDRHIDLFWAIWSLNHNLGTDRYTDYFLDQYGRQQVDMEVLRTVAAIEAFG